MILPPRTIFFKLKLSERKKVLGSAPKNLRSKIGLEAALGQFYSRPNFTNACSKSPQCVAHSYELERSPHRIKSAVEPIV